MTRLLFLIAPWAGFFCGIFGILIISTHLATGIAAILACAALLMLPEGSR